MKRSTLPKKKSEAIFSLYLYSKTAGTVGILNKTTKVITLAFFYTDIYLSKFLNKNTHLSLSHNWQFYILEQLVTSYHLAFKKSIFFLNKTYIVFSSL